MHIKQEPDNGTPEHIFVDITLEKDELRAIKDGYLIAETITVNGRVLNIGVCIKPEQILGKKE